MDYLEATVDKFVFRVARDCRYSDADVWAKRECPRAVQNDYHERLDQRVEPRRLSR